jgi:ferric-dicitrate binding protein FerR (iron transport regulator)
MSLSEEQIALLIWKSINKRLTDEETTILETYVNESPFNREKWEELANGRSMENKIKAYEHRADHKAANLRKIRSMIKVSPHNNFYQIKKWVAAAAAAIILVASIPWVYLLLQGKKILQQNISSTKKPLHDLLPGGNKAILTLSDGSVILLDTMGKSITRQGTTRILNKGGELVYQNGTAPSGETLYNTVSIPRGGQYRLLLPDGSKVWLNAASSLRFPASFSGTERRVFLSGEAYFEVAKNTAMPFKVSVNDLEVQVTGTHFNINSYADEQNITTTLLEGSVKVSRNGQIRTLCPSQEVHLTRNGQLTQPVTVDVYAAVAWKEGYFYFKHSGLKEIMRQLARWYDVDIIYQGNIPAGYFSGEMPKDAKASQVLEILKESGVRFTIEDKKIIVAG